MVAIVNHKSHSHHALCYNLQLSWSLLLLINMQGSLYGKQVSLWYFTTSCGLCKQNLQFPVSLWKKTIATRVKWMILLYIIVVNYCPCMLSPHTSSHQTHTATATQVHMC